MVLEIFSGKQLISAKIHFFKARVLEKRLDLRYRDSSIVRMSPGQEKVNSNRQAEEESKVDGTKDVVVAKRDEDNRGKSVVLHVAG